jgi:S-DNA-T family DNA segregation ATPase FtsK/SpoIIIE
VAARRGGAARSRPALLLLVDGVEPLLAQHDDADPARGSAAFLRLVRDGAAAGLTCVLTGDRAIPGGRLAGAVRERLVLPLPDRADYAVAGVPPRAVPDVRPPGRALLGETARECQLALPRGVVPAGGAPRASAIRVVELAADPELPLPGRAAAPPRRVPPLPVGPGGDEGAVLPVDLHRTGGLLVVGPPGSGRSSALAAFAAHLRHAGADVLEVDGTVPGRADLTGWPARLEGGPGVVVLDDLGAVADSPLLPALPAPGGDGGPVLIAAGLAADVARVYQGPIAALRRARSVLLLTPGPGDADLLGLRVPRAPVPARPGSGWLVAGGEVRRVQVARRRTGG